MPVPSLGKCRELCQDGMNRTFICYQEPAPVVLTFRVLVKIGQLLVQEGEWSKAEREKGKARVQDSK